MQNETDKAARMDASANVKRLRILERANEKAMLAELLNGVIHDYIRERVPGEGMQITGVIVGTVVDGMIVTGWSKTNLKAGDVYDKIYGLERAINRAKGLEDTPPLPPQLYRQMRDFQLRCIRYFRQASVLSTKGPYVAPVVDAPDVENLMKDLFGPELGEMFGLWGKQGFLKVC